MFIKHISKFIHFSKCLQTCLQNRCKSLGSKVIANSIQYLFVSKKFPSSANAATITKLVNYDLKRMPLQSSTFKLLQSDAGFWIEKDDQRQGVGYLKADLTKLTADTIHRIDVHAESIDEAGNLLYVNQFLIHFYA